MLVAHYRDRPAARVAEGPAAHAAAAGAIWLDLLDATEGERAVVERAFEMRVPAQDEIAEIESSSRLRVEGDVLFLSMPLASRKDPTRHLSPLGFVLSDTRLITVRYAQSFAFDDAAAAVAGGMAAPRAGTAAPGRSDPAGAVNTFLVLLEAMVDRAADGLERLASELALLSRSVFGVEDAPPRPNNDRLLRGLLKSVGRAGDTLSELRETLLGVQRIVSFVPDAAGEWLPAAADGRLATLARDTASLADYDAQLVAKVQFLLDAALGFINIEQNNGIKVLTVVSLVGIPPTLIASIYGMNFKNMPELSWSFGYPYALLLMLASVAGPLVFFWRKGWL